MAGARSLSMLAEATCAVPTYSSRPLTAGFVRTMNANTINIFVITRSAGSINRCWAANRILKLDIGICIAGLLC